jgi:MoaA/NifB/PqqE/SkfB family radical SAM enzyme
VVSWRAALDAGVDPAQHFGLGSLYTRITSQLRGALGEATRRPRAQSSGTRDGNGILFVAHDGALSPAGFLPISLGNVSRDNVVELYRTHPLLTAIRRSAFPGRCGACEFAALCGGSRSRAFAAFGDPLADDPACVLTRRAAE